MRYCFGILLVCSLLLIFSLSIQAKEENNCNDMWQQIDQLEKEKPKLQEMLDFARGRKPVILKTHEELSKYGAQMRRTLNENITKTLMKGWIDMAQEVNSLLSGNTITSDILSWITQKTAGIVMSDSSNPVGKLIVGDAYRKKKFDMISTKIHTLTPELEKLVQLSNASQESMLAWFNKYGKNTDLLAPGDPALFTNKMRLLIIQTEAAKRSLYALFAELKATETESQMLLDEINRETGLLKIRWNECLDRKNQTDKPAETIEPVSTESVKKQTSDVGDKYAGEIAAATVRQIQQIRDLMKRAAADANQVNARFSELNEAITEDLNSQAISIDSILKQAEKKREDDIKALLKTSRYKNVYGSEDSMFVSAEEMGNCPDLNVSYDRAISVSLQIRKKWEVIDQTYIDEYIKAADQAEYSAQEASITPITKEIAKLQAEAASYERAIGQGQQKLRALSVKMMLPEELNYPYSISTQIAAKLLWIEGWAKGMAAKGANLRSQCAFEKMKLEGQKQNNKQEEKMLPQQAAYCLKTLETSLKGILDQSDQAIRSAREYENAVNAYFEYFRLLKAQGVLDFKSEGGMDVYEVSNQWVESMLESAKGSCDALSGLQQALTRHALKLFTLKIEIDNVRVSGFPVIQESLVAKHNLPGLYSSIEAIKGPVENAAKIYNQNAQKLRRTVTNLDEISQHLNDQSLHMVQIAGIQKLFQKQMSTYKGLGNLIVQLENRLDGLLLLDRINALEQKEMPKALERYEKEYEQELGCLGEDHMFTKDIFPRFESIRKKLVKLKRKATFVDSASIIEPLQAIRNEIETLGIEDTEKYRNRVTDIDKEVKSLEAQFEKEKAGFNEPDQRTARRLLNEIESFYAAHQQQRLQDDEIKSYKDVQDFYREFAENYSNRDLGSVMAALGDEWQSAEDGITLTDLEDNLHNSFNIFDEVTFRISDMTITPSSMNRFKVQYLVTIKGHNYENDITHEEVSSVIEFVKKENNRVRIVETQNGRYWIKK